MYTFCIQACINNVLITSVYRNDECIHYEYLFWHLSCIQDVYMISCVQNVYRFPKFGSGLECIQK